MPEKFTVEQKEQIVTESFTATNIAELCRRHVVSVALFQRWKERFLEGGRKSLGNHQGEMNTGRRLMISNDLWVIKPL